MSLLIWTEHYKKLPCEMIPALKLLPWSEKDFSVRDGVVPFWPPLLSEQDVIRHVTGLLFMRQNHIQSDVALQEVDYRVLRVLSKEGLARLIMEVLTQLYVWCLKGKCPKYPALFKAQFFRRTVIRNYCFSQLARVVVNEDLWIKSEQWYVNKEGSLFE